VGLAGVGVFLHAADDACVCVGVAYGERECSRDGDYGDCSGGVDGFGSAGRGRAIDEDGGLWAEKCAGSAGVMMRYGVVWCGVVLGMLRIGLE